MLRHVGTGSSARLAISRRAGKLAAATVAAATVAVSAGVAGAAPQPTIGQAQKRLAHLMSLQDRAGNRYDQAIQQLATARQQLKLINREVQRDAADFQAMRGQIAQLAAAAYESGSMTSMGALLTSSNPQAVIAQASMLQQLSSTQGAQLRQFIAAARQVTNAQQTARRDEAAVTALKKQLLKRKKAIEAAVSAEQSLLNRLTGAARTLAAGGGVTFGTYTGPTNTPGEKAVAFAYAQLGKPYLWGATGPGAFDCSGLVEAAWAAAGVSIPRDTYGQYASLPHVPMSSIQPGDLIFFDGLGHVGVYVGNNTIIDAPQSGEDVELISLSSPWYAQTLVGAARP
ncbi:MAG: C40 family peptidase [Actinobacteria bacterium]|nr:C40 family peptidase [Actinomycetota bacterium]